MERDPNDLALSLAITHVSAAMPPRIKLQDPDIVT